MSIIKQLLHIFRCSKDIWYHLAHYFHICLTNKLPEVSLKYNFPGASPRDPDLENADITWSHFTDEEVLTLSLTDLTLSMRQVGKTIFTLDFRVQQGNEWVVERGPCLLISNLVLFPSTFLCHVIYAIRYSCIKTKTVTFHLFFSINYKSFRTKQ